MYPQVARRLRPYLFHGFKRSQCASASFRRSLVSSAQLRHAKDTNETARKDATHDHEKRVAQLDAYKSREEWHPRLSPKIVGQKTRIQEFITAYNSLANGESNTSSTVTVFGTYCNVLRFPGHQLMATR